MTKRLLHSILLSGAGLLAATTSALAGPLSTQGIPAGANSLIHVDVDAARHSPIVAAWLQEETKEIKEKLPKLQNIQKELGITEKDVNDITIGVFDDMEKEDTFPTKMVAIVRGNFDPEKIFTVARKYGCKIQTINRYHFIEIQFLISTKPLYVSPFGKHTVVAISQLSLANAAISAYRLERPSTLAPAALAKLRFALPETGDGHASTKAESPPFFVNYNKAPPAKKVSIHPGFDSPFRHPSHPFTSESTYDHTTKTWHRDFDPTFRETLFCFGGDGKNFSCKFIGGQDTAAEAQMSSTQFRTRLKEKTALRNATLRNIKTLPPSAYKTFIAKYATYALKLHQSIKIVAKGTDVFIAYLVPSTDILDIINDKPILENPHLLMQSPTK